MHFEDYEEVRFDFKKFFNRYLLFKILFHELFSACILVNVMKRPPDTNTLEDSIKEEPINI